MQVKKQQLELDMEQQTGSKLGKDYVKAFDCVDHNKLWKILKEMGIPDPDLPLEKPICRSRSNSQKWTWDNRLVPN